MVWSGDCTALGYLLGAAVRLPSVRNCARSSKEIPVVNSEGEIDRLAGRDGRWFLLDVFATYVNPTESVSNSLDRFFRGVDQQGRWTFQAARNLFLRHTDQLTGSQAIRDRGSQFVYAFDEIFRTERIKIPSPHACCQHIR
ncbi:MAG: hypothetical protein ACN4GZ_15845 [Acidimicrobiales bacterium]